MRVNKYSMFNADSQRDDEQFCDEGAGDVDDDGSVPNAKYVKLFIKQEQRMETSGVSHVGAWLGTDSFRRELPKV